MKDALLLVFANKQDIKGGMSENEKIKLAVAVQPSVRHRSLHFIPTSILTKVPLVALKPKEVSDVLQLERVAKNHIWKVEPSCATSGEGIFEGLVCCSNICFDVATI